MTIFLILGAIAVALMATVVVIGLTTGLYDEWLMPPFFIGALLLLVTLIAGGIRWGAITSASRTCDRYADSTDRPTRLVGDGFGSWVCFAQVDGEWYPIEQVYHGEPTQR